MATYIPEKADLVKIEGNTFDIIITFPTILDLSLFDEIILQIRNAGVLLVQKLLSDGTIIRTGQKITAKFTENDTLGKAGEHKWEIEFRNDTPEVITGCYGSIKINSKLII